MRSKRESQSGITSVPATIPLRALFLFSFFPTTTINVGWSGVEREGELLSLGKISQERVPITLHE